MLSRVAGRLVAALAVVLGVVLLTFVLLHVAPGDPARHLAGPAASAEQISALRERLGLDRPLPEQLLLWMSRAVQGNWGRSLATGRPVAAMLGEAWPWTAELVSLFTPPELHLLGMGLALVQARGRPRTDTAHLARLGVSVRDARILARGHARLALQPTSFASFPPSVRLASTPIFFRRVAGSWTDSIIWCCRSPLSP